MKLNAFPLKLGNLITLTQPCFRGSMSCRKTGQIYRCESWTIISQYQRNDVHRRIEFQRRLLRVHWTARKSNQSILKEINSEYSVEGLMVNLKLRYFGHLIRADSLEKTLMLGKIEGKRRRGQQRMR